MKLNDKIKNSNPYKVPEGYFDRLTERTMSAIRENRDQGEPLATDTKPDRRITLRPFFALAAAILGVAILATVMIRLVSTSRLSERYDTGYSLFADLATEELDTYMLEYELNQSDPLEMGQSQDGDISSEAIIDYLVMEDIDLNDIYELL
jgi:hypothetical protein